MKIQPSDIGRFLQLARKMWKLAFEDDSQIVVFTNTERSCSIAMARDGLLLTYLCNRVDTETSEQVIAAPFVLLQDCSNGTGTVELHEVVESGERCIAVKWSDGLGRCERTYATQEPPEYHLVSDLAWHTVDERMVRVLRSTETETDGEERATSPRVNSCPIEPIARVPC